MRRTVASILTVVLLILGVGVAAAAPAAATTLPKYSVTLKVTSTKAPTAGDWIKFTGSTSKKLKGEKVSVQVKHGSSKWTTAVLAKVSAAGKFSAKARSTGVGKYSYRAAVKKTRKHQASTSKSTNVTVFKYYYLADLDPTNEVIENRPGNCTGGCTGFHSGSGRIAGVTYSHSWITDVVSDGSRSLTEWNASYKCMTLVGTVGLDDSSPTTTVAYTLSIGGDDIPLGSAATGSSVKISQDITGVFRIDLAASDTAGRPYGSPHSTAVWGNARMLCSGKP